MSKTDSNTKQEITKQESTIQAESPKSSNVYVTPEIQLGDRKVKLVPIQGGLLEKSQKSK